jgi:glycine/D-amino acid oxidase-like deaminating enzyme
VKPVVVVGTGIVGASIGYHLAARGVPVTVIGRDAGVTASSFAWIGGDEGGDWPGVAADLAGLVLADWRRVEREVPGVGVRWTGSLRWPAPPGTGGRLVGPEAIAALEPHLRLVPERAIHSPGDGGVDPVRAARALLAAARAAGARVVPGATVVRVGADGAASTAGFHPASTVVLAAGAGSAELARRAGAGGAQATRLGGTSPALLIRVRARRAGVVRGIVAGDGFEVREVRERELLMAASLAGSWSWGDLRASAGGAVRRLRAAFGDELRLVGWRVGVRPMPVGGPVIGRLGPHLYAAVMHSGVCLAPSVGRLLAAEISSGGPAPAGRRTGR